MSSERVVSGKRFVPVFLLIILAAAGATLVFQRFAPKPDGAVLQLAAVDDRRALVIREGAGGRFPLLMLEEDRGKRPWARALQTTGGGVMPIVDPKNDRLYVATRDAASNRVVRLYALSSGEPLAEGGAPQPSAPVAFGLAPVVLGDEVLVLYGPHAAQLVRFHVTDQGEKAARTPLGTMMKAFRLQTGYLVVHDDGAATWIDRSTRKVGAPGSSYCGTSSEALELKADGRLVDPLSGEALGTLPSGAPLLACARRGDDWIVLRGNDRVERLLRVHDTHVVFDRALPVPAPALELPDRMPETALFVGEDDSLLALDLDRGEQRLLNGCGRVAAVLTTESEHFIFAEGRLIRLSNDAASAIEITLARMLLPRHNQLSDGALWLHQGLRVFPLDRETLRGPDVQPTQSACGRTAGAN